MLAGGVSHIVYHAGAAGALWYALSVGVTSSLPEKLTAEERSEGARLALTIYGARIRYLLYSGLLESPNLVYLLFLAH